MLEYPSIGFRFALRIGGDSSEAYEVYDDGPSCTPSSADSC
jgi:hypothetical protein